jgi:hypothetical protein
VDAVTGDANPCTRAAPCRTLQVAHNNTNVGGEINMLDPAGRIATDSDRRPRQRSGS